MFAPGWTQQEVCHKPVSSLTARFLTLRRDNVGGVSSWYRRSICQLAQGPPPSHGESQGWALSITLWSLDTPGPGPGAHCLCRHKSSEKIYQLPRKIHCSPITLGHYQHPMCCQHCAVTRLPPPGLSDTHWLRHHSPPAHGADWPRPARPAWPRTLYSPGRSQNRFYNQEEICRPRLLLLDHNYYSATPWQFQFSICRFDPLLGRWLGLFSHQKLMESIKC